MQKEYLAREQESAQMSFSMRMTALQKQNKRYLSYLRFCKIYSHFQERDAIVTAEHRANVLTIVGDLPSADAEPDKNVLFVCKLNPITTDEDLELIFSRFGDIKTAEIIRDRRTNQSLQYAFIEFATDDDCERAYFKMDNGTIINLVFIFSYVLF